MMSRWSTWREDNTEKNVAPDTIKLGGADGKADQNPITFVKG